MNRTPRIMTQCLTVVVASALLLAGTPSDNKNASAGLGLIKTQELHGWLTQLSSDEFEGRATFSEGLGLAAAYLASELKAMGVKPAGDNGSYFQRVAVRGVKSTSHSAVTVEANGQKRTFRDGQGVSFPKYVGAARNFSVDEVVFLGYGLNAPAADHNDFQGQDVRNKLVVWLGAQGPKAVDARSGRRLLAGRGRYAIDTAGAVASIGQEMQRGGGRGPGGGGGGGEAPDFTTAQRLDAAVPPNITADAEFFEFLFGASETSYAELKEAAARQEPLPIFSLKNVKVTFEVMATYDVIRTQYTRNVVGVVEGADPKLKDTCVAYGAHYDHVGYALGEVQDTGNGPRRQGAVGRVKEGALEDRIWNGADDDGSGSVVMLAVAKAFAQGPKTRRSQLFVWHTGEERGLWGSRYFADYPVRDIDKIVAQINMDMVGRNREDRAEESSTVYVVGSDRISTELHNISVDANGALPKPLTLDYELNDPTDPEQVYYRSDHFSYAAKGIPIIFLTTGLHPDYHGNTDSVDKINFDKMTRIAQLVYETGRRVGELDHAPARDNRGPRVGKGGSGKLAP